MKMPKFTSRDIKMFLFGMITMFALATAYDWENNWAEFKRGFNAGSSSSSSSH